jgi:hypothetical protein
VARDERAQSQSEAPFVQLERVEFQIAVTADSREWKPWAPADPVRLLNIRERKLFVWIAFQLAPARRSRLE